MKSTCENHMIDDFDLLEDYLKSLLEVIEGGPFLAIVSDIHDKVAEFREVHIDPWKKSDFPVHE